MSHSLSWPVVLNSSLSGSQIADILRSQGHRLRVSETTLPHTCIYPQSSVAFMIVPLNELWLKGGTEAQPNLDPTILRRIDKFLQLHRQRYILASGSPKGLCTVEQNLLMELQQRLIDDDVATIPVHTARQCVDSMLSIAKATYKPHADLIRERFKSMSGDNWSEEKAIQTLLQTGITEHDCFVVLQGCGSLADVALASKEQLLDCSLDATTADLLLEFFQNDFISA
ncbi:protein SPO16 homolog [Oscarella lobularis]|uniref:protein SPO16 homolog n=1 Tax=Oscarella lobularis TaxID=121494 RepID=UPI00331447CF